jgi:hypothetical protein
MTIACLAGNLAAPFKFALSTFATFSGFHFCLWVFANVGGVRFVAVSHTSTPGQDADSNGQD